jgi:putative PIN family toxin of toxin-antitoxin system
VLRIVVDTNLFVSSLLNRHGAPAQVIDAWRNRQYLLVVSEPIITEIRRVISSSSIQEKYAILDPDIEELLFLINHEALVVPGLAAVMDAIPDDPQDEMFLACAVDGQADMIVSGDRHLLVLQEYRGIPILTARQFLDQLAKE